MQPGGVVRFADNIPRSGPTRSLCRRNNHIPEKFTIVNWSASRWHGTNYGKSRQSLGHFLAHDLSTPNRRGFGGLQPDELAVPAETPLPTE